MNYFNIYLEELLDGEIHGFSGKSMVRMIDDLKEFQGLIKNNAEARGVIRDGELYLNTTNTHHILHTHILEYLWKKRIIKNKVTSEMFLEEGFELDDFVDQFLCVQVKNGKLYIGESYTDDFYLEILKDQSKIKKYITWMNQLGVPFIPEDILGEYSKDKINIAKNA